MTAAMAPTEKTGSGLPALLRLSGPVVASRLGIMAMGLVDTIVVGRYSAAELGYHALAWAVTGVVLTTALGLLSGVQVMTSQAIGKGREADTDKENHHTNQGWQTGGTGGGKGGEQRLRPRQPKCHAGPKHSGKGHTGQ